jgi:hypothetical protein
VFWRYNLSAHHDSAHSSHAKLQEALVGALERDPVKTVGGDRKERLTKEQKKRLSAFQQLPATAEAAATAAEAVTEAAAATTEASAEAAAAAPAPG